MHGSLLRLRSSPISALVAMLALALPCAAHGAERSGPPQPSTIERLVRQEVARRIELARFDAIATRDAGPSVAGTPTSAVTVRDAEFAWGAAALGLGTGVGLTCVFFGSVARVRSRAVLRDA